MRGAEVIEGDDLAMAIYCRQPFSKKEEGRIYWHEVRKGSSIN